jgi:cytochrome P450
VNRLAAAVRALRDPVGLLAGVGSRGDLVRLTGGRRPTFVVTSPDLAKEVLETNADAFLKSAGSRGIVRVMGEGLQVSEGAHHGRERALLDPGFAPDHVAGYAGAVQWAAARGTASWRDGAVIDAVPEMRGITTAAILRALFADVSAADVQRLTTDVTELATGLWRAVLPGSVALERSFLPGFRRFRQARERIDAYVAEAVRRRRAGADPPHDLLTGMLGARHGSEAMSDGDARDEVVSLLLAGRGTITAGLAWTWFLVGTHPDVEQRLHEEVDAVVSDDRAPATADLHRLPFAAAVWNEALRVYPPAWVLRRKAARAEAVGGTIVPTGSTVLVNVFGLHRDGARYPDPAAFDPGRFLGADPPGPYGYLPFGAGPRGCIGFHFTTMEAILLIATISRRWRLAPEERGTPRFARSITLRPRRPMRMRLAAR